MAARNAIVPARQGMKRTAVAALIALSSGARAALPGPGDPDWPCQQIKVPELSVAAVWNGPPLDAKTAAWTADAEVAALVERLAQRRIPIAQATDEITGFAERQGARKQAKLLALFGGLFDVLAQQRASVVAGLDRFGQRQKELAETLRAELDELRRQQDLPTPDQAKLADLGQRIGWDTRVFDDRRETLRYACQVPDLIEQRLFSFARTIQQLLQ